MYCWLNDAKESFLHRVVTGDEKWVYYENPKQQKARVLPGEPGPSSSQRNIHAQKVYFVGSRKYGIPRVAETSQKDHSCSL